MNLFEVRKNINLGVPLSSMNLKVTFYSRVSTDHIEQQSSLKNQVDYFIELINNNKNWMLVNGYVDSGISGTSIFKRDSFMKMINDARNGDFDLIITKEISRFSRNTLDSIKYTRELLSYGVAVLFINDNINTALSDSELRLTIMASMAQDEIRRLSERVKFGMKRSIRNGNVLGNNMLYGYRKNAKGNLSIIADEAFLVKRLFSLYVKEDYSLNKIADIFNKEDLKTIQNKKWCTSTLSRMIRNPKYKGYYCGNKTEIIDYMTKKVKKIPKEDWVYYEDNIKIPPIISKYLWDRANDKINKKNNAIIRKKYSWSRKIYCGMDNCLFHRRKQCKSTKDITWVCSNFLKNGKKSCACLNIRESELNTIIDDIVLNYNFDLECVYKILDSLYKRFNCKVDYLSKELIRNIYIDLLIDKVIVLVSEEEKKSILLKICWNLSKDYLLNDLKKYDFKRGFDAVCTKRYYVRYNVFSCFSQ